MVAKLSTILSVLPLAAAWPQVMEINAKLQKRVEPAPRAALFENGAPNTNRPALGFDAAAQFVDVSGDHAFQSPGPSDLRGECPGLNAVANHGYFPRNGIVDTAGTVTGLQQAYNMAPDLALFLSAVSIALIGDPVAGTWSIGGSYDPALPIEGRPTGILGAHNRYESDSSIVRGDAYLNNGRTGVFQMRSWEHLMDVLGDEDRYTYDKAASISDYQKRWSRENNPYFFSGPFAGLVSPAAHNFVVRFMSNHSAEEPSGYLNKEILKTFFAVTGDKKGEYVYHRGQERIPENFYKQPLENSYELVEVVADVFRMNAQYPGIIAIGGNTGTTNSFVGVDTGDLTGGVFDAAALSDPNKATCFFLQAATSGMSDALKPELGAAGSVLGQALKTLGPMGDKLGCPQLANFNNTLFNQFPGASYKAEGQ